MATDRPVTVKLTMEQGERLHTLAENAWGEWTGQADDPEYDLLRSLTIAVGTGVENAKALARKKARTERDP